MNPLATEYELDLKQGANDLYIKVVNHDGPSYLTYAFRSPAIEVPSKLVKLVSIPLPDRSDDVKAALQKYYRNVYCLHPDWMAMISQEKGTRKAKEEAGERDCHHARLEGTRSTATGTYPEAWPVRSAW